MFDYESVDFRAVRRESAYRGRYTGSQFQEVTDAGKWRGPIQIFNSADSRKEQR